MCVCMCKYICIDIYIYVCVNVYIYIYTYTPTYVYIHIYIYVYLCLYIYIQRGSGTEPRTGKGTGNIGTEPEPFIYFIFTNRTQPVGNRTVWSANRKHEPVANRLRLAGICLFSIYSSTGFFARVHPVMFLATFACANISLAAEETKGENGERRETGKSNGLESR